MGLIRNLFGQPDDDMDELPEEPTEEVNNKPSRVIGRITHINEDRGYGFITSQEIKFTKIFFHWSALERDTLNFTKLRKGMKVEFEPKEYADTGFRAIRIRVLVDE